MNDSGGKSKIEINRVDGDVVISQNQQGGSTSHTATTDSGQDRSKRRSFSKRDMEIPSKRRLSYLLCNKPCDCGSLPLTKIPTG